MFGHSSKNLKNHEKQASTKKENVRQRNGGHEESQNPHDEVWRKNEQKTLLSHEEDSQEKNDRRHEGRCQA
jgi:hypothetical protein